MMQIDPVRRRLLQTMLSSLLILSTSELEWIKNAMAGNWLPLPALPDVQLLDQDGRTLYLLSEILQGRLVMLNFIFTDCSSVCPSQTAILLEVLRQLRVQPSTRDALMVSITVDPVVDQPDRLRNYAKNFDLPVGLNNGWILLTGAFENIAQVLTAFGISTARPEAHSPLLWLGDTSRQRWVRTSALNPPPTIMQLIADIRR